MGVDSYPICVPDFLASSMRYLYIPAILLLLSLVIMGAVVAAVIATNRARVCLHGALAQTLPAAIDWGSWQRGEGYHLTGDPGVAMTTSSIFWQCVSNLRIASVVTHFTYIWGEEAPYALGPGDRVWGVTERTVVEPPFVAGCAHMEFRRFLGLFRGGRTCVVIAIRPGVLAP